MRAGVIPLLRALKYATPNMAEVFMNGSCFKLCRILQAVYPDATPLYSHIDGHWITQIDGCYYDIHGEVAGSYAAAKEYEPQDARTMQSADVPHHGSQGSSYQKYVESI